MLAGRMKLKNFMFLAGLIVLGGLGALWFASVGDDDLGPPEPTEPEPVRGPVERVQGGKPVFAGAEHEGIDMAWVDVPLSEVDHRAVVEMAQRMAGDKTKDAWGPGAGKLNLYDDDGDGRADRAKLDWDRDDKPDQKFEQVQDRVRMSWSPGDDEDYSQEFELDATASNWVRRHGDVLYVTHGRDLVTEPLPADLLPTEPVLEQVEQTPVDALTRELLSWRGKQASGGKLKDVSRGQSYKINVYQDEGEASINRAKVDLDRDDAWDIKVTFAEAVTRQVAPSDDEVYSVEETWDGSQWAPL
jgi:hypothetical protein